MIPISNANRAANKASTEKPFSLTTAVANAAAPAAKAAEEDPFITRALLVERNPGYTDRAIGGRKKSKRFKKKPSKKRSKKRSRKRHTRSKK